jgi:CubicO group peptidase (beta-lactamase class C family)
VKLRRFVRALAPLLALVLSIVLSAVSSRAQSDFSAIDAIVNHAVDEHQLPGAVVIVGHGGRVAFRQAYGMRSLEPTQERMTLDTIFDMASLTKPLTTAVAVMQLYEQGKIGLNDSPTGSRTSRSGTC